MESLINMKNIPYLKNTKILKIEDTIVLIKNGKKFTFGEKESRLLALIDGSNTMEDIQRMSMMKEYENSNFCNMLIDKKLWVYVNKPVHRYKKYNINYIFIKKIIDIE